MSKTRYTIETLASGQPRPYADSIRHVRLTGESFYPWLGDENHPNSSWKPRTITEDDAKQLFSAMKCGFPTKEPTEWHHTRLDWIRSTAEGVWEFHATTPFTD